MASGSRLQAPGLALAVLLAGCPEVPPPRSEPTSHRATPDETPTATPQTAHAPGERVQLVKKAMGTRVTLAGYTTETLGPRQLAAALESAHREIARIEALMTTWREDSEVSRVNRAAGTSFIEISDETFGVIAKSLWISNLSEGVFDITFASMGKLWRFDEDRTPVIPDAKALELAREKIDYRRIKLDDKARSVMLERADTRINLGGIAKGYAIDRAAGVLRNAGVTSFFAQAGGDLYVEGTKPDGKPWRVGVRDPRGPEESYFALLPVQNRAFSTAGDYERAYVIDGKRYHHIIDPRTGYPATASRSVTIWAKDALTADAIDDAVFILGPEKGLALVESLDDTGAVIVDKDNKIWVSKRLDGLVQILKQPTDGI